MITICTNITGGSVMLLNLKMLLKQREYIKYERT